MFLTQEESKFGTIPFGTKKIFDVKMSISGMQGSKIDYGYVYQIYSEGYFVGGGVLIKEEKGSFKNTNLHRVCLSITIDAVLSCLIISGNSNFRETFVRLHTPYLTTLDPIIKRSFLKWTKDLKNGVIRNTHKAIVSNQDLWGLLLYYAESVSIGIFEVDKDAFWYQELHKIAQSISGMERQEWMRKKSPKILLKESSKKRRKMKNKLKELQKTL